MTTAYNVIMLILYALLILTAFCWLIIQCFICLLKCYVKYHRPLNEPYNQITELSNHDSQQVPQQTLINIDATKI